MLILYLSFVYALFPRFPHSFLVSGDFCCLLITFANSLFPDQYRQNVGPDLDTDRLTPARCFEKVNFERKASR